MRFMRGFVLPTFVIAAIAVLSLVLAYAYYFGPADPSGIKTSFVVTPEMTLADVTWRLEEEHIVRSGTALSLALAARLSERGIRPGGYEVSSSMDVHVIAKTLTDAPYFVWLTVRPGHRKEQIADRLAEEFGWTAEEKRQWITVDTAPSPSFVEGVYFPGIYLLPSDFTPAQIAERLRGKFKEVFAPYALEAAQKDIPWTTIINIAALIEREAAGPHDMSLISGIIWNRLHENMPLGIDATLQYIKGKEGEWWPLAKSEDKYLESPYNTYFRSGLPAGPIANPGLDAIKAALRPRETACMYYLHDYDGDIHCSETYRQHVANVHRYLR